VNLKTSSKDFSDCGIVYVASGSKYVAEARVSAQSAKRVMPDIPITLFSDEPVDDEAFDSVVVLDAPQYSMHDKQQAIGRTPYGRTLYADADTYFCCAMPECFELLNRFDLLVAHDALRVNVGNPEITPLFPEFNAGLIWYRKDRCEELLANWYSRFSADCAKFGPKYSDQVSFRAALFESSVRMYVLPPEYHCMLWEASYVCGEVKLLHGRNDIDPEVLAQEVNAIKGGRVFKAGLGAHRVNFKSDICSWAGSVVANQTAEVLRLGRS
jgi:hypothetical protein